MSELLVSSPEASSPQRPEPPLIDEFEPEDPGDGLIVPRVLGRFEGAEPGPTLIVVGGLHGNEPAGVLAFQRVYERLTADPHGIERGRLVGLAGNLEALARKRRYVEHDLNRHWLPERVERLRRTAEPLESEDRELRELDRELERERERASDRFFVLDLHTTSGRRLPFATLDDTLPNRKLAFELPVPVVLGIEEELAGTMATHLSGDGVTVAGFEGGQHDDPTSIDRAEAAIWITLETCGLVPKGSRPEAAEGRRALARATGKVPHVVEVRYRHPITPEDWFRMDPGWENFQQVQKGQSLAMDRNGAIHAPKDGLMLMPLYQRQGADGFFLVRRVRFFWLQLSAIVRRLHSERLLHWLPGIERHSEIPDAFVVDRQTARWLARQLFHLLGYRRLGPRGERYLVMARRNHDRS